MDFLNTPEKKERRLVHLPMGRFGEAVELAKAALFCTFSAVMLLTGRSDFIISYAVASDDSSYMTVCLPSIVYDIL
jgi:hypothetical protein